jgi:predicted amidohydrolase
MTLSNAPFTAACIQMRSGMDPAANLDQATGLIREAAGQGASYVQTPEMTNAVCRHRDILFSRIALEEKDASLAAFRDLARELGLHLHLGSLAILREDGKVANRGFLIDAAGEIAARYDKLHLFDADLPNGESWRESRTYTGGDKAVAADLPAGRLGMTICYDLRFPHLYKALAEAGASILSAPSCFTRQTGEAHWVVLQRARAIETGSFMISAAQAGQHEDGRESFGHSIIVDPWGKVLVEGDDKPGVFGAVIDLAAVADARGRIPTSQHTRSFKVEVAGHPSLASAMTA